MSFNTQKLKPLNHKQNANNLLIGNKNVLTKTLSNNIQKPLQSTLNPTLAKKNSTNLKKQIQSSPSRNLQKKPAMKSIRSSTKTIQHYDCDDFEYELQDNNYFQTQLQKNIKTEGMQKKPLSQNKALVVLPKLQTQVKVKALKDLQKQMDLQMSRMYQKDQHDNNYY